MLSKSNFSVTDVHWVVYKIRYENKNFDDMNTLQIIGTTKLTT